MGSASVRIPAIVSAVSVVIAVSVAVSDDNHFVAVAFFVSFEVTVAVPAALAPVPDNDDPVTVAVSVVSVSVVTSAVVSAAA